MIVLDTHVWVWWASEPGRLTPPQREALASEAEIGVSAISCWEVAKLVERGRLDLDRPVLDWLRAALAYPGVHLVGITPEVAAESASLPGEFHRDPADQLLVATARVRQCRLATSDRRIVEYAHVETV